MRRWKVRRWALASPSGEPLLLWVATSPRINDEIGYLLCPFGTWREAFDYADRMSRGDYS